MPKSNLYTRTGDSGLTSLVDGSRIGKDSLRLDSYGTIDELSSQLGVLAASSGTPNEISGQLKAVQNELFNIGSYLATPQNSGFPVNCSSLKDGEKVATLEGWIDALDEQTPKIRAFVLPGGHFAAAQAHVARTVCRRAERIIIALAKQEYVDQTVITYVNRLSDYLFAAARYLNFVNNIDEITWQQDR